MRIITYLKYFLAVGTFLFATSMLQVSANAATISMQVDSVPFIVGQDYDLRIYINTEGQNSTGADAHITYDSGLITLENITPGSIYETYPQNTFDFSLIDIGGLSTGQNPYNGSNGLFATVLFRPSNPGNAVFTFNYSGTTQTTVSLDGANLLNGQPEGLSLTVQAAEGSPTPTPTPILTSTLTPTPTPILSPTLTLTITPTAQSTITPSPNTTPILPKTGFLDGQENIKIFIGIVLIILGVAGYKELKIK